MGQQIWKKRVLVPFWIIQLIILTIEIGLVGWALWAVRKADEDGDFAGYHIGDTVTAFEIGASISLGCYVLGMILTVVEIGLYATHRLKPGLFLATSCTKMLLWTAFVGLAIYSAAIGNPSALEIFLNLAMFISSVVLFGYGYNVFRHNRNGTSSSSSSCDQTKSQV